jgi:hypothetical protein
MIRMEIIANQSVEEDLLAALHAQGLAKCYTKYNGVHGVGASGPRLGDAVWPEENFSLVIWCGEEEALGITQVIRSVKERLPNEGIKLFALPELPFAAGESPTEGNPA